MKRATTAALLAVLLLPGAARAQEDDGAGPEVTEPEQQGVEVAQPPGPAAQGQEQVSETYVVRPGDTLWDLSQRYLGNPWYWPKVWSYNPEIANPHWIYPGNTIRFYPGGEEMPAQVEADVLPLAPTELDDVTMGNLEAPEQFGEDDDVVAIAQGVKFGYVPPKRSLLRQDGLVTQRELDDAGVIEKSYAEKELLDTYERVYLSFRNRGAVRLGERYSIFRTRGTVQHPVSGEDYGYLTHIIGTLRVVALGKEYVTGMIEQTFEPIERGDFVGPLGNFDKQIIVKNNVRRMKGVILAALVQEMPFLGEQHWVFIDKGSRDGVEEGNSFYVVHRGDPIVGDKQLPDEVAGMLLVVDVKDRAASCLVVRSLRELSVGDEVVMKTSAGAQASVP